MNFDQTAYGVLFENALGQPQLPMHQGGGAWLFERRGDAVLWRDTLEPTRGKGKVVRVVVRYVVEEK